MTKKPSEFLADLGSHSIYDAAGLAQDWKEQTGLEPCWSTHTAADTKRAIEKRGLGGTLKLKSVNCWGYEVAIDCARKMVPGFVSTKLGRGSAFWEAIEALKAAGK